MSVPKTDFDLLREILRRREEGPAEVAALCREILDSGTLPQGISRTTVLLQLGEYSQMAGDAATAERAFRDAVAEPPDDDRTGADPRCHLAEWCFDYGDPEEARRLLEDVWRSRPRDVDTYVAIGELLEHRGDGAGAIKWLTAGALRTLRDDEQPLEELQFILAARRRVRLAQGFDEDDYDVMAEELDARLYDDLGDIPPA